MKSRHFFKLKGLLTLIMCISAISLSAQNVTVRGTVTDAKNEPIIGATIIVVGNPGQGVITDIDGKYTFPNVSKNASLQFSYMGMKMQIIPVNGRTNINVKMEEDSEVLGEVVVTALGVTKQARSVGYATSKVFNFGN